ncbi:DUF4150 domain-containing protein [Thalassotalea ganghwensis]
MTKYINAQAGDEAPSVHYDIDELSADIKTGGNQAWRHTNVALLSLNISARQHNAIGSAYGVAVFAKKKDSQEAFITECQRPKYKGRTLGEMVNIFIPDHIIEPPQWDEENQQAILPWIEPVTGLDVNAELSDYDAFLSLVEQHIGWQTGSSQTIEKDKKAPAPTVMTVSGNNVLVNGKTAVHKDSGGVLQTVDVCLTTVGNAVVPIPYPNIALSSDAASTASSVKINGNPACHKDSNFAKSTGDEAGDQKGVKSGTIKDKAHFVTYSFDVFVEGSAITRAGDLMVSNNKNTPPAPLMQPPGPMPRGLKIKKKKAKQAQNDQQQILIKMSGNEKLDTDLIVKG